MTTTHKPATPLPWKSDEAEDLPPAVIRSNEYGDGIAEVTGGERDAAYIAHAANAYPKLVDALESAQKEITRYRRLNELARGLQNIEGPMQRKIRALLRELGEAV